MDVEITFSVVPGLDSVAHEVVRTVGTPVVGPLESNGILRNGMTIPEVVGISDDSIRITEGLSE